MPRLLIVASCLWSATALANHARLRVFEPSGARVLRVGGAHASAIIYLLPGAALDSVSVRTGEVVGSAPWSLTLGLSSGLQYFTTTLPLQPDAWLTWQLPTPINVPFGTLELRIEPTAAGSEAEFLNLSTHLEVPNAFTGFWTPSVATESSDGGRRAEGSATLVLTHPQGLNNGLQFAGACSPLDGGVVGNPYAQTASLLVPAGGSATHVIPFWPIYPGQRAGIADLCLDIDRMSSQSVTIELEAAGTPSVSAITMPSGATCIRPTAFVPEVPDGGFLTPVRVTVRPQGGPCTIRGATALLSGVSRCHPAAQATWSMGTADAGFDWAMSLNISTHPTAIYPDVDGDNFGDRAHPQELWGFNPPPGFVFSGDDCDDTNAAVHPAVPEVCDGVDNDCDGILDARPGGPLWGELCAKQSGVCASARETCIAAQYSCDYGPGYEPTESTCDGLDNDCDGATDEVTEGPACAEQRGVCAGSHANVCADQRWAPCDAATYGAQYEAEESRCDGLDNDCDGTVDEATQGPLCPLQSGVCAGAHPTRCTNGAWAACDATVYGADFELAETRCDGLDNDCDGVTDGDDPTALVRAPCSRSLGVCEGAVHTPQQCRAGAWEVCGINEYGAGFESEETRCDGLDNDCDGKIDETCEAERGCGCSTWPGAPALLLAALLRRRRRDAHS